MCELKSVVFICICVFLVVIVVIKLLFMFIESLCSGVLNCVVRLLWIVCRFLKVWWVIFGLLESGVIVIRFLIWRCVFVSVVFSKWGVLNCLVLNFVGLLLVLIWSSIVSVFLSFLVVWFKWFRSFLLFMFCMWLKIFVVSFVLFDCRCLMSF